MSEVGRETKIGKSEPRSSLFTLSLPSPSSLIKLANGGVGAHYFTLRSNAKKSSAEERRLQATASLQEENTKLPHQTSVTKRSVAMQ